MIQRCTLYASLLGLAAIASGQVVNGGFESPQININSWSVNPANVPGWTFFGDSGLANGSTTWCSSSHSGTQYAFLRANGAISGRISQRIGGFIPGNSYRIRFWMQKRSGMAPVTLGVRKDGVDIVRPFHTVGIWLEYATDWFVATSAAADFEFYAQQETTDKASVIDDVSVEAGPPPPLGLPSNPSFELPPFPPGTWQSPPAGIDMAWEFFGSSGIEHGPSSWGSGAQDGNQYAFLQQSAFFYQRVGDFQTDRTYHAEWYMMRRNGNVGGNNGQPIRVLLDQSEIFPFTLYDSPDWKNFASLPFTPAAKSGVLRFEGGANTGDKSELFDNVRLFANTDLAPESYTLLQGTYVSGNVASMGGSDNQYLRLAPGQNLYRGGPHIQLIVEATAPFPTASYFAVLVESACTLPGLNQRIEMWDVPNQQWVTVRQSSPSNVDSTVVAVRSEDAWHFVNDVTRKVRCRISMFLINPNVPRNWEYRIDQVRFSVSPN